MKQEDKELLIKDLCARMSYGVKIQCGDYLFTFDKEHMGIGLLYTDFNRNPLESPKIILSGCYYGEDIKPYLFPLSSMTEEQWMDTPYANLNKFTFDSFKCGCLTLAFETYEVNLNYVVEFINWCYKNHFDCNGLIPLGLAIDATNLNIY